MKLHLGIWAAITQKIFLPGDKKKRIVSYVTAAQILLFSLGHSSPKNFIKEEVASLTQNQVREVVEFMKGIKQSEKTNTSQGMCKTLPVVGDDTPSTSVLISLSVPEQILFSISKELELEGGAFVLRGLPKGGFHDLAKKIEGFRKAGINATFQINPLPFRKHHIELVPAYVIKDGEKEHVVLGAVSLTAAKEIVQ